MQTKIQELSSLYGAQVSEFTMALPESVIRMTELLTVIGQPFIVGGSVRDSIMGVSEPKDFDIEVFGVSLQDITKFLREQGYRVDTVGQSFGVLKVTRDGNEFDISVPRKESRQGVGHRGFDVSFDADITLTEAASRRDFTINAIMYDVQNEVLVDPFNGLHDIRNEVLRHTSSAFGEDPLRPLRAFQFAARFGFTLAPETIRICQNLRSQYSAISTERVKGEWEKFYTQGIHLAKGLEALEAMGWDDTVSGLSTVDTQALGEAAFDTPMVIASVIASGMSQPRAFLEATVIGKRNVRAAEMLAHYVGIRDLSDVEVMEAARDLVGVGADIATLIRAQDYLWYNTESLTTRASAWGLLQSAPEVLLTAREVLEANSDRTAGPWLGELMKQFERTQDLREVTTREGAIKWASEYLARLDQIKAYANK